MSESVLKLSSCLTKTGENLSSLSLLPSAVDQYRCVNNSSSFRSLLICIATALVIIHVDFMRPHWLTILESGNMFLRSSATRCGILKGRLCSTRKPEKSPSVAGIAPKFVNFLCCWAASTYLLCFEVSLCLLLLFSPPFSTLKSRQHTVHKVKPSPFWDF